MFLCKVPMLPPQNDTDINEIFALLVFFPYIQEF